jgi:2Fe-2S ferredoxin
MIEITFIYYDENNRQVVKIVQGQQGESVLQIAWKHNIPLEGACGGCLACSTCHVIVDEAHFKNIKSISDAEEDMLEFAFGKTKTSRLGCQVILDESMNGTIFHVPPSRNFNPSVASRSSPSICDNGGKL